LESMWEHVLIRGPFEMKVLALTVTNVDLYIRIVLSPAEILT
jgi:hypothetical protein